MMHHDEFLTPERISGDLPDAVDVVVVGGGAAGCVLAARFSEVSGCEVLLLEAGSTTGWSQMRGFRVRPCGCGVAGHRGAIALPRSSRWAAAG
jgi:choline dehydrogenase-like flavoprotein